MMVMLNESSTQRFNENAQLCKSGQPKDLMRMLNFANQVKFLLQFLVVDWSRRCIPSDFSKKSCSLKSAQSENSTSIFNFANMVRLNFFRIWVMVFTFTIDRSVEILDSYFDEHFQLRRAFRASICTSGFHACFGPWRALRASIQDRGKFLTSSSKAFDCFGPRLRALTRS